MEKKRWYKMPDMQKESRASMKESLNDNPDIIFLGFVVGVIWVVWFGITWGD